MALSIKAESTDRIVRRYARLKGLSYTRAIHVAVQTALRTEGADEIEPDADRAARVRAEIRAIQERVASLPVLDDRSADELLYDGSGLPK